MSHATATRLPSADELAALSAAQMVERLQAQAQTIESLKQQLDWFKRQLFGAKSERFIAPNAQQLHLGELVSSLPLADAPHKTVAAHTRRVPTRDATADAESLPFFDESRGRSKPSRCRWPRSRAWRPTNSR